MDQFIEVYFERFAKIGTSLTMKKHIMSSPDNVFNFGVFGNGVDMEIFVQSTSLRGAVIQVNSPDG